MFAGIVEAKAKLLEYTLEDHTARIKIEKPQEFQDIRTGDSISVNGVCLTVEEFNSQLMQFCLGAETLKITGWTKSFLESRPLNLERSLKWGDRLHGHLVSGHVDATAVVIESRDLGGSWFLKVKISNPNLHSMFWKKGSIAINGVSLTVNEAHRDELEVCLIPETLKRTNLGALVIGDQVTIEVDQLARSLARKNELEGAPRELNS